ALAVASAIGNRAMEIEARIRLGGAYQALGRSRQSVDLLRAALASLEGTSGRGQSGTAALPAVPAPVFLSVALADLGEFREGIALGEEAVRLAEGSGQPFSLSLAYGTAGSVYVSQGDWQAAIRWLEKGLRICEERQIARHFPYFAWPLGRAYA